MLQRERAAAALRLSLGGEAADELPGDQAQAFAGSNRRAVQFSPRTRLTLQ
jgi:hypothetical protein